MTDREHILLLLKENPSLTQVELSEMMDKSRRTVQMLMKELLDEGANSARTERSIRVSGVTVPLETA